MNRRTFLKTSLTSATLASSSTFAASIAPSVPVKPRLRIGFLGMAHSHAAGKLSAVQASPEWELVGVCDEKAELRERFQKQGVRVLSQAELLREADVIAVESAVRDHYRHTNAALTAGKHVHVEKPPATTLAEFKELQSLALQNKRLMQMGYMWRYHPGIAKVIEAVREGWLGDVSSVRCSMNSNYTAPTSRAEVAEFRGGGMFELGSHLIDVVVRLLGRPEKIISTLRTHGSSTDKLADNAVALFEYPRALATISINLLEPNASARRFLEVIGSNGTALLQPIEAPVLQFDLAKPAGPYTARQQSVPLPKYQRYVPEFADLAQALRVGRPLAVTPETDLLVHECLMKACEM